MNSVRTFCYSKHYHPSMAEAEYCNKLLSDKQSKKIKDFKCQESVPLHIGGKIWKSWKIDFLVYENDGSVTYHECKGRNLSDQSFRLKCTAFMIEYPDRRLLVNWQPPNLTPGRRLMLKAYLKHSHKRTIKRSGLKTWDRSKGKWVPLKVV